MIPINGFPSHGNLCTSPIVLWLLIPQKEFYTRPLYLKKYAQDVKLVIEMTGMSSACFGNDTQP